MHVRSAVRIDMFLFLSIRMVVSFTYTVDEDEEQNIISEHIV